MNLEHEVINLSNNLNVNKHNENLEIISRIKFIVDYLKQDKKEMSIYALDEILAKYKKVFKKEEFSSLKSGVFVIKVALYSDYNKNDLNGFIEDCIKEIIKENAYKD